MNKRVVGKEIQGSVYTDQHLSFHEKVTQKRDSVRICVENISKNRQKVVLNAASAIKKKKGKFLKSIKFS